MEKMTNKSAIEYVLEKYNDTLPADVQEKLEIMLKRLSETKAKTPEQKAKEKAKRMAENAPILDCATEIAKTVHEPMKLKEWASKISACLGETISTQKLTPLFKELEAQQIVEKFDKKGYAGYGLYDSTAKASE